MSDEELFRKEALSGRSAAWLGTVRVGAPLSHAVWACVAILVVVAVFGWLWLGHYTRREHVAGNLVPVRGLITITSRAQGVVTEVLANEGQQVKKGDPVVVISAAHMTEGHGDTGEDIASQLRGQKERLLANVEDVERLAAQSVTDLRAQQDMLQGQLAQIDAQVAITQKTVDGLSALLVKFKPLRNKGYVSALDIQQQETQELQAEAEVKALNRQRYETRQQLSNISGQLLSLPNVTRQKVNDLRRQIAQVEQGLDQNDMERGFVLHAPSAGVVTSVTVKPGQSVATGQSVAAIVPEGSPLEARLLVPSSAIGFVQVGTPVSIRYQSFPYQKFGVQRGAVATIATSALTPSEVTAMLGAQPPNQDLYLVTVKLTRQDIQAYGELAPLRAGMRLDASLLLDRRRLFEWLFEPLFGMRHRLQESE